MTFKSEQGKLQKKGYSKESAGKILGAAAQKAKHPSAKQKKVLKAQGGKKKSRLQKWGEVVTDVEDEMGVASALVLAFTVGFTATLVISAAIVWNVVSLSAEAWQRVRS